MVGKCFGRSYEENGGWKMFSMILMKKMKFADLKVKALRRINKKLELMRPKSTLDHRAKEAKENF